MDYEFVLESRSFISIAREYGKELITDIGNISQIPDHVMRLEEKESQIFFSCFTERINGQFIEDGVVVVTSNNVYFLKELRSEGEERARVRKKKYKLFQFDQRTSYVLPNPVPLLEVFHIEPTFKEKKKIVECVVLYNSACEPFSRITCGEIEDGGKETLLNFEMFTNMADFADLKRVKEQFKNMKDFPGIPDLPNINLKGITMKKALNLPGLKGVKDLTKMVDFSVLQDAKDITDIADFSQIMKALKLGGEKTDVKRSEKNIRAFLSVLEGLFKQQTLILPVSKPPLRNSEDLETGRSREFSSNSGKLNYEINEYSHLEPLRITVYPPSNDREEEGIERNRNENSNQESYEVEFGPFKEVKRMFKKTKVKADRKITMKEDDLVELLSLGVVNSHYLFRRHYQKLYDNNIHEYQRQVSLTPLRFSVIHSCEKTGKRNKFMEKGILNQDIVNMRNNFANAVTSVKDSEIVFSSQVVCISKRTLVKKLKKPKSNCYMNYLSENMGKKQVIILIKRVNRSGVVNVSLNEYDYTRGVLEGSLFSDIKNVISVDYFQKISLVSLITKGLGASVAKRRVDIQFSCGENEACKAFVDILQELHNCYIDFNPFFTTTIKQIIDIQNDFCDLFSGKYRKFLIKCEFPYFETIKLEFDKYLHYFHGVEAVFFSSELVSTAKIVIMLTDKYLFTFKQHLDGLRLRRKIWNDNIRKVVQKKKSTILISFKTDKKESLKFSSTNSSEIEAIVGIFSKFLRLESCSGNESRNLWNKSNQILEHKLYGEVNEKVLSKDDRKKICIKKAIIWYNKEDLYKMSKYIDKLIVIKKDEDGLSDYENSFLRNCISKREKLKIMCQVKEIKDRWDFHSAVERLFYYCPLIGDDFILVFKEISSIGERLGLCFSSSNEPVHQKRSLNEMFRCVQMSRRELEKLMFLRKVYDVNTRFEENLSIQSISTVPNLESFVLFFESMLCNEGFPERMHSKRDGKINVEEINHAFSVCVKCVKKFEEIIEKVNSTEVFERSSECLQIITEVIDRISFTYEMFSKIDHKFKGSLVNEFQDVFFRSWNIIIGKERSSDVEEIVEEVINKLLGLSRKIRENLIFIKRENGFLPNHLKDVMSKINSLTSSTRITTRLEEMIRNEGSDDNRSISTFLSPHDFVQHLFKVSRNSSEFEEMFIKNMINRSLENDPEEEDEGEGEGEGEGEIPNEGVQENPDDSQSQNEVQEELSENFVKYVLDELLSIQENERLTDLLRNLRRSECIRLMRERLLAPNLERIEIGRINKMVEDELGDSLRMKVEFFFRGATEFVVNKPKLIKDFAWNFWGDLKIPEKKMFEYFMEYFLRNVNGDDEQHVSLIKNHYLKHEDCFRLCKFMIYLLGEDLVDLSQIPSEIIDMKRNESILLYSYRLIRIDGFELRRDIDKREVMCSVPGNDLFARLTDIVKRIVQQFSEFQFTISRPLIESLDDVGDDHKNKVMNKILEDKLLIVLCEIFSEGFQKSDEYETFWDVFEKIILSQMNEQEIVLQNLKKFLDQITIISGDVHVPPLAKFKSFVLWCLNFGVSADVFKMFFEVSGFENLYNFSKSFLAKEKIRKVLFVSMEKLSDLPFVLDFSKHIISLRNLTEIEVGS